ncbi:SIS domain-containing protein [bacterium]|nr:SIS domain-containing protein [bacterium]
MFFHKNRQTSMEQEIFEQAYVLNNLLETHVNDNNYILFDIPTDIQKVVLVASGSSYHCARYTADLFGNVANIEARAIYSSEFLLKSAVPHEDTILYVFITQSGETSDTNSALQKAKELGMRTLCITNKKGSSIWEGSDFQIDCHAGEEKSIAATKSLTTQMLCCTLLVLKYAAHKGIDIAPFIEQLKTLSKSVEETYKLQPKIKKTAKFLSKFKNMVVTADGISYALAKETSLKIKETSYINVYSSILGEFMHGHLAVLNNKQAMIYVSVNELNYTAIKNLNKIKDDYNPALCVIGCSNEKISPKFNLDIPCESPIVKSFCLVVIIQLLALEIATALHKNVDKPHGLNKVVK